MPGIQGKPVPPKMKAFIIEAARDNPTRTNADIGKMVEESFGWYPDLSNIAKFRRDAGIPSSRKAASQVPTSPLLTSEKKDYVQKLLGKLVLPHPDTLKASEVVRARGNGMIGSLDEKFRVWFDGKKLMECWLPETGFKTLDSVTTGMKDVPNLRLFYEDGIKIV
jgi:hypothetical protein